TRHDPKSIMHYSLPEEFFRDGKNNKCWVQPNHELSDGDKQFAASIYPLRVAGLDPGNKAALPPLAPPEGKEGEENFRAELQRNFESLLTKAGVKRERVKDLTQKFAQRVKVLRAAPAKPAKK